MKAVGYAQARFADFVAELKEFLRIPSISTQHEHKADVEKAAHWLCDRLQVAGFPHVEVVRTPGQPVVCAEWCEAGADRPTVLMYSHYDVQPPGLLEQWNTPPFEPVVRGDDLYARGASDAKGQLYVLVKAIEALSATDRRLSVNVKCLFEGEEESGSPSLVPFIQENRQRLSADLLLVSDSAMLGIGQPAIVYGLRGIAQVDIEVTGPAQDLHSGRFGGAVHNPIHALCAMIASLHDRDGRVAFPGFYDRVRDLTTEERNELARIPFEPEAWLRTAGVTADWGEKAYTITERTSVRPALDVNGIWGGYVQEGTKTVIPSSAHAKVSMRLVPDQRPAEICHYLCQHLHAVSPPEVSVQVREHTGGEPMLSRLDSPAMRVAKEAYEVGFGVSPVFIRRGGSIPAVAALQKELGVDPVLIGFGLPDDQIHAPNEKVHLPNLLQGINTVIHFLTHLRTST